MFKVKIIILGVGVKGIRKLGATSNKLNGKDIIQACKDGSYWSCGIQYSMLTRLILVNLAGKKLYYSIPLLQHISLWLVSFTA